MVMQLSVLGVAALFSMCCIAYIIIGCRRPKGGKLLLKGLDELDEELGQDTSKKKNNKALKADWVSEWDTQTGKRKVIWNLGDDIKDLYAMKKEDLELEEIVVVGKTVTTKSGGI